MLPIKLQNSCKAVAKVKPVGYHDNLLDSLNTSTMIPIDFNVPVLCIASYVEKIVRVCGLLLNTVVI